MKPRKKQYSYIAMTKSFGIGIKTWRRKTTKGERHHLRKQKLNVSLLSQGS